jgi:lipoprotein NlpI
LDNKPNGPSEFDMARLDNMIQKIEAVDKAAFFSFRGIYYAYLGEKEKSLKYHDLSIAELPNRSDVYNNFVSSLECFGEFGMAVEAGLKALATDGYYNEEYMRNLLTNAYYARRDDVIAEWLPEYHKIAKTEHFIEMLIKSDNIDQDKDVTASELMAVSLASGAFDDVFSTGEDEAWLHLQ